MAADQETVDLRSKISPARTPSRYVSDAFNFLQDSEYRISDGSIEEEKNENNRISAHENSVKRLTNSSINANDSDKHDEVNFVQESADTPFTIITSVDDTAPPPKCQGGIYVSSSSGKHTNAATTNGQDEFTIVTYVNDEIDGGSANALWESEYINAVYDVESTNNEMDAKLKEFDARIKDKDKVGNDVRDTTALNKNVENESSQIDVSDGDKAEIKVNTDAIKLDNQVVNEVSVDTESHVVESDGDLVELRTSPRDSKIRQSRAGTWRTNQRVVSEAFGFLTDFRVSDEVDGALTEANGLKNDKIFSQQNDSNNVATNSLRENPEAEQESLKSSQDNVNVLKDISTTDVINTDIQPVEINGQLPNDTVENSVRTNIPHIAGEPQSDEAVHTAVPELSGAGNEPKGDVAVPELSGAGCSENDELGELVGDASKSAAVKIRARRKPEKRTESGEEDGGSSDEDTGVYRESFRKSTWVYVGDNSDLTRRKGDNPSNYVALADLNVATCETDSIFGDVDDSTTPPTPSSRQSHRRNDSTVTTTSENEFRSHYNSVRKRLVQRAESHQEYKRLTTRVYDHVESYTIEKSRESGYGIHILDCIPAVISGVDAGSVAEATGVKEGQVLISINGVNVLDMNHEGILDLVQQDSTRLSLRVGSGDPSSALVLQAPVMTGYLLKQTTATIFKSWKRRFFILRGDNCLYYYKNEQESDPLGAIPLNGFTVSRHGDMNKCGFKAEKYGSRTSYFMAYTRAEMGSWVSALNEAAQRGTSKGDAWMDVTTSNLHLPALGIRKPDCVGYLYTMGRVTRMWRRRYCVLKDACIYYYKNTSSKEAEGVAHLHGYKVSDEMVGSKKFSFCLRPPEPQMRVFSFHTDNDTDRTRWIESLTTSIQKWVKVD